MKRRVTLILIALVSSLIITLPNVKSVSAQETIVINSDGSIERTTCKILMQKLEFNHQWKPSFESHKQAEKFTKFAKLANKVLENTLLPASNDLKAIIQTRRNWIRQKRTEKTEESFRLLSIVFGLVGILEVVTPILQISTNQFETLSILIIELTLGLILIFILGIIFRVPSRKK